ncbi:MAG: Antitoxin component of bacterial toxin-antitoxin system, MqsA, partial [Candidatus Binatota bacterium]|nr:Antitoxin component of bacterial toxin-antitoxin system, MqsA [Candidatus Binatota bacterium]
ELKRLRTRMGLTQKQLGAELGVTENSVARWERDEVKMNETAARLMRTIAAISQQKKKK